MTIAGQSDADAFNFDDRMERMAQTIHAGKIPLAKKADEYISYKCGPDTLTLYRENDHTNVTLMHALSANINEVMTFKLNGKGAKILDLKKAIRNTNGGTDIPFEGDSMNKRLAEAWLTICKSVAGFGAMATTKTGAISELNLIQN